MISFLANLFLSSVVSDFFYIIFKLTEGWQLSFHRFANEHPAFYLLSPEITLVTGGITLYLIHFLLPRKWLRFIVMPLALSTQLMSLSMTIHMIYVTSRFYTYNLGRYWGGQETIDPFSLFWAQTVDVIALIVILISFRYPPLEPYLPEFYALLNFATASIEFMVASSDVMTIWLMTEFSSIMLYLLIALVRGKRVIAEGLLKFFLLGTFSGILILFGCAILYGLTGSTNLYDFKWMFTYHELYNPIAALSLAFIGAGLGFKIGIAPFHLWIPDTFEAAPTPVVAFMSAAPKAGGLCVFARFLLLGLQPLKDFWIPVLILMAILGMVVGTFGALHQTNLKRLLGYSGVAHMGFMLSAIAVAASQNKTLETESAGFHAAVFYIYAYVFFNLGAFAIITFLESQGIEPEMSAYSGLAYRSPFTAFLMTVFLLALAGIPPTSGFWAKWWVFFAALEESSYPLVVVMGAMTVLGLYYYARILYWMYMVPPKEGAEKFYTPPLSTAMAWGILIPTTGVFIMSFLAPIFYLYAQTVYLLNWPI